MIVVLVLSSLGLLLLPGCLRRAGRRLPPAEWAQLSVVVLGVGAVMFETALLLLGAPTVLRALGAPVLADICQRLLGSLVPGGPVAGWWAAGSAIAIPAIAGRGAWQAIRAHRALRIEPLLGRHHGLGRHELVVLPSQQVFAFSIAGRRSQVIVSEGLAGQLSPQELQAVLRHEVAHLERRHQRWLVLVTALEHGLVLLPLLRRSTAALRCALERWADEDAAGNSPEGRATLHAALVRVTNAMLAPGVAAFSAADTLLERLQAMERALPPPPLLQRWLVYVPLALIGGLTVMSLGLWLGDAHFVVATMGLCPA